MNTFNLGYNFDMTLPTALGALNKKHAGRIKSVYGSDREHAWLSARPDFRLPEIGAHALEQHVHMLKANGIEFNYTMNSPYLGTKAELDERTPEFLQWAHDLVDMGVKRFIISNPILIDLLHRKAPTLDVKLELSTIMHIDTPMQLVAFKQIDDRVDTVVGNILYNRNFQKLKAFTKAAFNVGMEYEVMVNEFCGITGKGEQPNVAHCVYRDSCYQCHSGNVTKADALSMQNYPMGKCMSSRAHEVADWLRVFWVRPQDLRYYNEVGVSQFKITGRTAQTPYVASMARAYMTGVYNDNLLALWKPLETIYSGKEELSEHDQRMYMPTEKLDGFITPFVTGVLDCTELLCSECKYCDGVAERILKEMEEVSTE